MKQYGLQLSRSRRLLISLRRFRIAKAYRSTNYRQLVLTFGHLPIRQVAVRIERRRRQQRRLQQPRLIWRRHHGVLATLMIIAGIVGATYFGVQAASVNQKERLEPAKTFSVPVAKQPVQHYLRHSQPTHLTIASVGIDVDTIPVGLADDGTIQMPPLFDWVTGWYTGSPSPGEKGPAIIVGHVDTYKGISVFWRLRDVKPGDIISINRADGSVVSFKVDALKQFDQANFPTKEVYGNIDHAGLRLITCGGAFDRSSESYTQNTVVYASMVQ